VSVAALAGWFFSNRGRSMSAAPEGVPLATVPGTVIGRWSANHSAVTLASGRVVAATPVGGAAPGDLLQIGGVLGPVELTDGLGRKFWRFDNASALKNNVLALATRNLAVIMVGRRLSKGPGGNTPILSLGSAEDAAPPNIGGALLGTNVSAASAAFLRPAGQSPGAGDVNRAIWGSQIHVFGYSSGAAAAYVQTNQLQTGAITAAFNATHTGFEVARNAFSPGSPGTEQGGLNYASMDIYEIIMLNTLSQADMLTAWASVQAAYGISNLTDQLLLMGDSLTEGWAGADVGGRVRVGQSIADRLGETGAAYALPTHWRIITEAVSGSTVATSTTRRQQANHPSRYLLSGGRNVASLQIGINDMTIAAQTPVQTRQAIAAFLNTATDGIFQRGWSVILNHNSAVGNVGNQALVVSLRSELLSGTFLTEAGANSGEPNEAAYRMNMLSAWTDGANTIFSTSADAGDTAYYQTDSLHYRQEGTLEYAKSVRAALVSFVGPL
jgi:lysophospholipase L1-like esterase